MEPNMAASSNGQVKENGREVDCPRPKFAVGEWVYDDDDPHGVNVHHIISRRYYRGFWRYTDVQGIEWCEVFLSTPSVCGNPLYRRR
jgi:hypothetical protein